MPGTWFKFHDDFFDHPKVIGLSPTATTLYLRALCYASKHLTDGRLPITAIESWGVRRWRSSLAELVDRGLWVRPQVDHRSTIGTPYPSDPMVEEWYEIHDYLDYQRSAADARKLKVKRAEAGSKGGAAKAAKAKQTPSKVLEAGLAEKRREEPSSSPPATDTGAVPPGNVNTEDDYTATINHMARCDLERARANGVTIGNEAAWMRATVENRSTNDGEAVRYELSRRHGGKYYPVHIEAAEAVDDKCGPPDGGRARADAKAAETTAARLELEADLAATRADPEATRRGAAAARAALASHPDQGAA